MKQIKFKKLVLDRFRGQSREVDFNEGVTEIHGRNKSGKTTIHNAILFVLTGFDNLNRANLELFDRHFDYNEHDNPKTEVVITITVGDFDYELKRGAQKSYTRKRSTGEYVKDPNDSYEYSIDGISRSPKEYYAWIEENIAPIDKLKCILNIYHFMYNIDDWKEQRRLLAEISGEITKEDFKGDYNELYAEMNKYSLDELKERVKSMSKPLIEKIGRAKKKGSLTIEIETMENNLPDLDKVTEAESLISEKKLELNSIDDEIKSIQESVNPYREKREQELKAIDQIKNDQRKAQNEFEAQQIEATRKINHDIMDVESNIDRAEREYNESCITEREREVVAEINKIFESNAKTKIDNARNKSAYNAKVVELKELHDVLEIKEEHISTLRKERDALKEKVFHVDNCSYCGQELPSDKIEELRRDFDSKKNTELATIVKQGFKLRPEIDELRARVSDLQQIVDKGDNQSKYINTADLEEELKTLQSADKIEFHQTIEYAAFKADIEKLKESLNNFPVFDDSDFKSKIKAIEDNLTEIPVVDINELSEKQKQLNNEIAELSKVLGLKDEHDKQLVKIDKIKSQRRDIAQELAIWDKLDNLITEYEREYASIVQNRTNALFNRVQVSMIKYNKNNEPSDDCEVFYDSVPSRVLNYAERSLSGIDIAQAFMKYFNVQLPLIVDNVESINADTIPVLEGQVIKLIVSETDKNLRIV